MILLRGITALSVCRGSISNIDIETDRTAQDRLDISLYHVTAYGSYRAGALGLSGQLGYATGDVDSERQAFERIEGTYDIGGFYAQGLASYRYGFAETYYVEPLIGVQYGSISADAYAETGGLDISFADRDSDYLEGRAGVKLGTQVENADSFSDYFVSVALVSDLSGDQDNLNIGYANQTLSLSTLEMEDTRIDGQVGFNWISSDALSVGATVDGKFSDTYTSFGGQVRLKYRF
ncbi:autotransporter outer membrane beta-barrel domain-containing protein [Litorimonas sp. RW-G-Af-16]|uniref:autotransporter outer membrane beta-barrel domain-containing protein n=1 Tax=Litorimonas sp. RW-G-Af-16 TaxID=3241168 RepID=UPI003AAB9D00